MWVGPGPLASDWHNVGLVAQREFSGRVYTHLGHLNSVLAGLSVIHLVILPRLGMILHYVCFRLALVAHTPRRYLPGPRWADYINLIGPMCASYINGPQEKYNSHTGRTW